MLSRQSRHCRLEASGISSALVSRKISRASLLQWETIRLTRFPAPRRCDGSEYVFLDIPSKVFLRYANSIFTQLRRSQEIPLKLSSSPKNTSQVLSFDQIQEFPENGLRWPSRAFRSGSLGGGFDTFCLNSCSWRNLISEALQRFF